MDLLCNYRHSSSEDIGLVTLLSFQRMMHLRIYDDNFQFHLFHLLIYSKFYLYRSPSDNDLSDDILNNRMEVISL